MLRSAKSGPSGLDFELVRIGPQNAAAAQAEKVAETDERQDFGSGRGEWI